MKLNLLPKILAGYVALIVVLIVSSVVLLLSMNRIVQDFNFIVEHDQPVLVNTSELSKALVDIETGERGFLLTGDESFLEPYTAGNATFDTLIEEQKQLVSDNPSQVQKLEEIQAEKEAWVAQVIDPAIELRRDFNAGVEGVTLQTIDDVISEGTGKAFLDEMRADLAAFQEVENELNAQRVEGAQTTVTNSIILTVVVVLVGTVIGLGVGLVISRSTVNNVQNVMEAAAAISRGDLKQRASVSSNDEIAELATRFNNMADTIAEMMANEQEARRTLERTVTTYVDFMGDVATGQLNSRLNLEAVNNDELYRLGDMLNATTARLEDMIEAERQARETLETTVDEYVAFVEAVAKGNLNERLHLANGNGNGHALAQDDPLYLLGSNLNEMVAGLADMTEQTQDVATRLASAAAEILAASTQQLSSSTEQDASITQTTATVDEVRATVQQTAERATTVADKARESFEVSQRGEQAVTESMDGMQVIRDRVEGIATNILALSEKTQQIGDIIATVNDIAEQSKMLALNASIEAARAGEEGKGFSVVAMEVRNLAEQSREATEQVRAILNEIQQATNAAVMATEEGAKGVDSGQAQVKQAGTVIRELAKIIREASQAATQIAASTRQQTTGMEQLASAMEAIRQASIQSQASTQQTERSAQDLNAMAQQMQTTVRRYQL